jgi:peptidoglycan/LPS O-acetylase OafA/YrhL
MVFHIAETNHIYLASGRLSRALLGVILYGWAGVDLFFVLSGFLITGILVNARGTERYFTTFYARRVLRIFPLYYAVLVLLFVIVPLVPRLYTEGIQIARQNQWWYWTYLTNVPLSLGMNAIPWPTTHLWSLAVEEQFYLVWPAVVYLCSTYHRLLVACSAGIAISIGFRVWAILFSAFPLGAYFSTIGRMDALLVGAVLAVLFTHGRLTPSRVRFARRVGVIAAALIVIMKGTLIVPERVRTFQIVGYALNAAVAGGLIASAATTARETAMSRVWRSRFLAFFGRYSYALYVFHFLVIAALNQVYRLRPVDAGPDAANLDVGRLLIWSVAYFGITVGASLASWHLLERPFLRLKQLVRNGGS